ncbi:MAG TPA: gamma-glutamyltransferase, partial [Bryobacteraceae bacterium]|nr:gamma-glutamyltransferase [Bryobacteraceae bacterium]
SIDGWKAPGVPGTVRGLELAHRKFGSRRWRSLIAPATRLATNGFDISYELASSLKAASTRLGNDPESRRVFLRNPQPGRRLIQRDLGRTLARIARLGSRGFYSGPTARTFAAQMKAHGGLITAEDLEHYRAVEREPLRGRYREHEVITAPPPSSGGTGLLQMLGVLEGSGYEKAGFHSARHIHFVTETMRRYYADRSEYMGDPDYFKVPLRSLLAPNYVGKLRKSIDRNRATPSDRIRPGPHPAESTETTHFSIVDARGNAASLTYTLNGGYGSGVTVPGLGVLLNNEMDDFAARPGTPNMFGLVRGEANAIQPGKRPLSSMTPTILTRDGKLFLVVGGPGGGRIITSVLQTVTNVVDFRMNIRDAVDAPRFHHQWKPDVLTLEPGISPDTVELLRSMGHKVEASASVARIFAILVQPDGWLAGTADGRSYGKAVGY